MTDLNDLYRRLVLAAGFAEERGLPRVADALRELEESILSTAPGQYVQIADLVGALGACPDFDMASSTHRPVRLWAV